MQLALKLREPLQPLARYYGRKGNRALGSRRGFASRRTNTVDVVDVVDVVPRVGLIRFFCDSRRVGP
jgi:hypothetical protein